jgi:PEP-CTERM motif
VKGGRKALEGFIRCVWAKPSMVLVSVTRLTGAASLLLPDMGILSMIRKVIALSVMLASVPAAANSTLSFNFAGPTGSAPSFTYAGTPIVGAVSQGPLSITVTAVKFFPTPELLAGSNISALTTAGVVTRYVGSPTRPAGLGVDGGGDSRQIDTNTAGTLLAPLREALLLSGDSMFALRSLTLNLVDQNDTLLLFGVDPAGVLIRLGFGSTVSQDPGNPGTIRGGLDGLAKDQVSTPLSLTGQTTETFGIAPTELYSQYLFTTRVGGDVLFGGDTGNGFQLLGLETALPEPGTWAMMIGGFGLAGASMRRRRAAAAA